MKTLTALMLYGLLGAAHAANPSVAPATPPTLQDFGWQQRLEINGQEAAYRYALPAAAYAGSRRSDLGDLRVFNGSGELVPHAFLPHATAEETPPQYVRLPYFPVMASATANAGMHIDLRADKDGRLSALRVDSGPATTGATQTTRAYVLDASALKQTITALKLDWRAKDNVATVSVEASDNLQDWYPLRNQAQLVDLRVGEERLLKNRIELGGVRSKYLRLNWSGVDPLEIKSVEAEIAAGPIAAMPLQWNTVDGVQVGETAGEYLFYNAGLPVTGLHIALPQANTVVPLRIFHRDSTKSPWRDAGGVTAYRLTHQGQELVSPDLVVYPSRDRYWRIVADIRGGGLGPGMPGVSLGWTPQEILFIARGQPPFTLAYGNTEISPAGYAPTTLLPGYKDEQLATLPRAQSGMVITATGTASATPPADPAARHKLVLWIVLLLGIGILGVMVWRLMRQMNKP